MTLHEILEKLGRGPALLIREGELDALVKEAKLLSETDTIVNGFIRVLDCRG